jgi:hypothetical protein
MNNKDIMRLILIVSSTLLLVGMLFIVMGFIDVAISGIAYMLNNPLNVLVGSIIGLILLTLYNSYIKSI